MSLARDLKMEARHWWIASKIQDTFSIGGTTNPAGLEEYICEPETLDLINELFLAGGQRRLFFYVEREKGLSKKCTKDFLVVLVLNSKQCVKVMYQKKFNSFSTCPV